LGYLEKSKQTLRFDGKIQLLDFVGRFSKFLRSIRSQCCLMSKNATFWSIFKHSEAVLLGIGRVTEALLIIRDASFSLSFSPGSAALWQLPRPSSHHAMADESGLFPCRKVRERKKRVRI